MLWPKVCASTLTLLPEASCKPASAWQARQSVSATAMRGAAKSSAPKMNAIEEAVFMQTPLLALRVQELSVQLLLQRADEGDYVLDLRIGQLGAIGRHLVLAVLGRGKQLCIGSLDHLRGLEGENLHILGHRRSGQPVRAV